MRDCRYRATRYRADHFLPVTCPSTPGRPGQSNCASAAGLSRRQRRIARTRPHGQMPLLCGVIRVACSPSKGSSNTLQGLHPPALARTHQEWQTSILCGGGGNPAVRVSFDLGPVTRRVVSLGMSSAGSLVLLGQLFACNRPKPVWFQQRAWSKGQKAVNRVNEGLAPPATADLHRRAARLIRDGAVNSLCFHNHRVGERPGKGVEPFEHSAFGPNLAGRPRCIQPPALQGQARRDPQGVAVSVMITLGQRRPAAPPRPWPSAACRRLRWRWFDAAGTPTGS